MRPKYMKIILIFCLVLNISPAFCQSNVFYVNGMRFTADMTKRTAELGGPEKVNGEYIYTPCIDVNTTGDILIPDVFEMYGRTYTVTSIASNAFKDCTKISSITIPNSVTSIGDKAFTGCSSIKEIYIPDSVTSVGFDGCTSLSKVHLPSNLTSICQYMFRGCINLKNIQIPTSVKTVNNLAFSGSVFTKIELPKSVETINTSAFKGCTNLESIILGEGVKSSLGYYMFDGCINLRSIYSKMQTPPNSYNGKAFENMNASPTFYVPIGKKSSYQSKWGWSLNFEEADTPLMFMSEIMIDDTPTNVDFIITDSINNTVSLGFGYDAACPSSSADTFVVPSNIRNCEGQEYKVTEIGKFAFKDRTFSKIILPHNIRNIDQDSFKGCSQLSTINIPNSVVDIQDAFTGCTSLKTVIVGWRNPLEVSISTDVFSDIPSDAILYVPAGTKERYEVLEPWNKFSQIIESSPISIGDISASFNSQANLPVYLKNTETVEGLQFKLILPEGITVVNDNGMLVTSNTERTEGMTIMGRKDPDEENSYLFIVFSFNDNPILGNNGEIMNVRLNLASDIELGTYEIRIDDIYMTTTSLETLHPSESSSELTVKDYMLGDVNNDGIINITDAIGIVNHVLKNTPAVFVEGAADVNMDGFINVTDAIAVINMILN